MLGPKKKKRKEKEPTKEKEQKKMGVSHYERRENSVNADEVPSPEPEFDDEETLDSRERKDESFKQEDDKVEIIFDVESYRPSMIRAAIILETDSDVIVFKTAQLQRQFAIRDIVKAFIEKAPMFKSGDELIEYFKRNPIPSKGSIRHGLSKYYIEYNGKKYPLSIFTPSGRAKKS